MKADSSVRSGQVKSKSCPSWHSLDIVRLEWIWKAWAKNGSGSNQSLDGEAGMRPS